jgi:hypothetical protein
VVLPGLQDAQRLSRSARARGFFVHVHREADDGGWDRLH